MPQLSLEELPEAIPIPYRSTAEPDGLDLNTLLLPNPISTFYLRVRGHRLRGWGVHDGDLRPLVRQAGQWQLQPLGPEEAPIQLNPDALEESGMFGVGVRVGHQLLGRSPLTPPQTPQRSLHPTDAPCRSSGRRPLRQRRSSGG